MLPVPDVIRLIQATKRIQDPQYSGYEEHYYYVLVGFGLYAGCRAGEACARKWTDIDWREGTVFVGSQIRPNNTEGPTKNKVIGHVELAPEMLASLKALKEHSEGEYILGGRQKTGGTWLSAKNLEDRYLKLTAFALGKGTRNYHALRHRFATSLVDAGTPIHEVKALCRHKKIATTYLYVAGNTAKRESRVTSPFVWYRPSGHPRWDVRWCRKLEVVRLTFTK